MTDVLYFNKCLKYGIKYKWKYLYQLQVSRVQYVKVRRKKTLNLPYLSNSIHLFHIAIHASAISLKTTIYYKQKQFQKCVK